MTKRNTKKALVVSLLSLLLCCSMLVGTTFAWFTDSVTSGNNKIVAGNLDVELEYLVGGTWKPVTETTNVFEENTLWEPGHTEVVYLKVSNLGTLALDYKLGVNIAHETGSTNVGGAEFKLSDYIQMAAIKGVTTAYANREAARAAVTSSKAINEGYAQEGTLHPANNLPTDGVKEEYVALVVYMPESVGNEANYKTGYAAPQILLGINLYATQETYENDSYGTDYDGTAKLPLVGTGAAPVEENAAFVYVEARDMQDGSKPKLASITAPMSAVAGDAENVTIRVEKTSLNQGIVIDADNQEAVTYDVTVTGLKEGNTTPINVEITIGSGKSGIKLYHYEQEITDFYYNESKGILSFKTTHFSPFSVVYDAEYKAPEVTPDTALPQAELTTFTADELAAINATNADWLNISLLDSLEVKEGQTLAAAYKFKAPHTAETIDACTYKDWICDFFVKIELADGSIAQLPAGMLYLAGNYGTWGWIGFTNPTVNANEFIPMLSSVADPWTYANVAVDVGTFQCGVARAEGYDTSILNNAKFTVQLRLVDPANYDNYETVSEVVYNFPEVVTSGE